MPWRPAASALALVCLAACSDIQPQVTLPAPGPGAADIRLAPIRPPAWDKSLEGLRADDQRVADVAFRIATANAELCTDLAPLSGLVLQSALEYSPRLRPAAEAMFRLDDRPAVEAVAAGSPADAAGFRPDDVIVAVDGAPLAAAPPPPQGADERAATYAPVASAMAAITRALADGPARIAAIRAGAQIQLTLQPRVGCAYDAQVIPGPGLDASADGRHVFISTAMVSYAGDEDRLALVLGHEYAHDLLHHRERLDRKGFARALLGNLGSTPASLVLTEKEADYVGLYLTARAGYGIGNAPDFWRRFPAGAADFDWTHPGIEERVAALAATRDEIARKHAAGEPLLPTPAAGAATTP
ncbi:MAG TPA: M48 family metalloprotease [Caulobacteraceae bacterium]|nr:M48 family metalloprotease [Caulobacteraceae bacterium]